MAPYDFIGFIALDSFGTFIPGFHMPGGIEHKNGIVPDAVHHEPKMLFAILQCRRRSHALGNILNTVDNVGNLALVIEYWNIERTPVTFLKRATFFGRPADVV